MRKVASFIGGWTGWRDYANLSSRPNQMTATRDISFDGDKISVPSANMLAMSSLWRLIVSDLSPTDRSSPFLSFPVKGEVLLSVGEILSKGFTFPQNGAAIDELYFLEGCRNM